MKNRPELILSIFILFIFAYIVYGAEERQYAPEAISLKSLLIKKQAEGSYSNNEDKVFDIVLIETRWINETPQKILWVKARFGDPWWGGTIQCDTEHNPKKCDIICRVEPADELWKESCFTHEYCHVKQYEGYLNNPPRNIVTVFPPDWYVSENQWEEKCYLEEWNYKIKHRKGSMSFSEPMGKNKYPAGVRES